MTGEEDRMAAWSPCSRLPISVLHHVGRIDDGDQDLFRLSEAIFSHFLRDLEDQFAQYRSEDRGDEEIRRARPLGPAFDEILEAGRGEGRKEERIERTLADISLGQIVE